MLKAKDLKKSLEHCHDANQNERRAGLCNLLIYLRREDTHLSDSDITSVRETLKRFFPEHSSKLYRVFLEVLHDFIQLYCESLEGWIDTVVRRLIDRLGSELLSSLQTLIRKTLSSLQLCYVPGFLFKITAKVISRNDSFEKKSKLASLDYFGELLPLLQPEDFYDQPDLEKCLLTLATDLSTTNSALRLRTQDILSVLFDLNPTTFNLFLSRLPEKLVDNLKRSIRRHWAKVIENENLSPRKTFRSPPHEDMRGRVQKDNKLKKHISLTDLLHFPSDSEETSSNEQLSKSFSVNVPTDSKLALYSVNHSSQAQSYPQPPIPSPQHDILISDSTHLSNTESLLSGFVSFQISNPYPIPTPDPPVLSPEPQTIIQTNLESRTDYTLNSPNIISTSQSYPIISMQSIDTNSSVSTQSVELPLVEASCTPQRLSPNGAVLIQRKTAEVTRSRIPVSVNYSPRISSAERARVLQLFSLENRDSFLFIRKNTGSSRPCSYIDSNPNSSICTPSRIPLFKRKTSLNSSIPSPSQLISVTSVPQKGSSDKLGDYFDKNEQKYFYETPERAKSATTPSKKERRTRVCLDFGQRNNKLVDYPTNSFNEGIQTKNCNDIHSILQGNSNITLAPKQVVLVSHPLGTTPPSCGREEDPSTSLDTSSLALPSDSIEDELSAPAVSHSCHELQTASSTSLDSEGESRLSPTSQSLNKHAPTHPISTERDSVWSESTTVCIQSIHT